MAQEAEQPLEMGGKAVGELGCHFKLGRGGTSLVAQWSRMLPMQGTRV